MFLREHRHTFLRQQLHFELFDDRQCDLVLNGENVRQLTVEPLGPKLISVAGVDQLGGDPEPIAHLLDTTLEEGVDVEPPSDLTKIHGLASEGERGPAGDHEETLDMRQCVDELLRQPLTEVIVLRDRPEVDEGQDGNGGCALTRPNIGAEVNINSALLRLLCELQ